MKNITSYLLQKWFFVLFIFFFLFVGVQNSLAQVGALASIVISPSSVNMQAGVQQQFVVVGKDSQGNTVALTTPQAQGTGGTMAVNHDPATGTTTIDYTAGQQTGSDYYIEVWDAAVTDSPGNTGAIWGSSNITIGELGVDEIEDLPNEFSLKQNYPNPFNPNTAIQFNVASSVHVKLKVHNLLGKEVLTLIDSEYQPGQHSVAFNANQLSAGIYFYRVIMGDYTAVKKMVLIK